MPNIRSIILFLCSFIFLILLNSYKAFAVPEIVRLGGADRYDTSVRISQNNWQQSNYVVIASGENYPDALCAAPLAKKYLAPVLLSSKDYLSNGVIQELKRLGVKNAFIVGGVGALSQNIEYQLETLNIGSSRLQGKDRYETSVKVAELIGTDNGVVITSGENFPDALSIAPIAGSRQIPILLSPPKALPESIRTFLESSTITSIYVIGGSGVINDSAVSGLGSFKRLSGSNRYDTNKAVIEEFVGSVNISNIYMATGEAFPDALSGSAAAAKNNSIIVLTDNVSCSASSIIQSNLTNISSVKILGGSSRVSDGFVEKLLYINNKTILGYATYYYNGDTSSYNSLVTNSSLINSIATDTFGIDGLGNIKGNVPFNQLDYANSKDIKAYAMISNYFDGSITKAMLESQGNRERLINNVLASLKAYNYKGVNVDLEGIYYDDREYFSCFMKELYNTLHSQGFEVTIAVPAKTRDSIYDKWTWAYDYLEIGKYSDKVVIMTYDEHYFGGTAGPIASINWVNSVVNYAVTVIPKEKLLLGIAGYGYDWSASGSKAYGVGQAYSIAAQHGAAVKWDSVSKSPYYNYIDQSGVAHTVWFENSASIEYKLDLVNSYDLEGIALWRLGLENSDYWTSIKNKLAY